MLFFSQPLTVCQCACLINIRVVGMYIVTLCFYVLFLAQSQFLTQETLVFLCLDCCTLLLAGLPACAIWPLQLRQNEAARLVFNLHMFSDSTLLLNTLHWLLMAAWIWFRSLVLYCAASGSGPSYIQVIVKTASPLRSITDNRPATRSLRDGPNNNIMTVCCRGSTIVERAPHWHQDSRTWSHLQPETTKTKCGTWSRSDYLMKLMYLHDSLNIWVESIWLNALIVSLYINVMKCSRLHV